MLLPTLVMYRYEQKKPQGKKLTEKNDTQKPGGEFHLQDPDINQELYGLPEYFSALNSAWLNESATLYRRKYFLNGAHAGYVMYVTALRDMMTRFKGSGNFKNIFYHAPRRKSGRH